MITRIRVSAARLSLLTLAVVAAGAQPALAQRTSGSADSSTIGERYHFEASSTMWKPGLVGKISSDALNLVGSSIDFGRDLGFDTTRVTTINLVLRPAKKHRFRGELSPVQYAADTTFSRIVNFAGVPFPVSLPIHSTFEWRTWRFGYEYDFIYRKRGFVGVLFEGRATEIHASLASNAVGGTTTGTALLPAIGLVGRAYVAPHVAVNFEVSGLCALHSKTQQLALQCKPATNPDYQASYFDWNVFGTINFTNFVGAQFGWRRATTTLDFGSDRGQIAFQGIWFGAVVRY